MSAPADHPPRGGFPWLLVVVTLAALAVLLSLGTWQVQRLQWKEALIATIDQRLAAPPVPLADVEAVQPRSDIEYRPTRVAGTFLHDREQFFLATHDGQSGWYVYTPLRLDDGRILFVNRGFVPFDRRDPATRAEGQVAGRVELDGLAREAPAAKPSWVVPDNEPAKRTFYWKDLSAMTQAAALGGEQVVPFFVDAGRAANPGDLPVGGVTIVSLPNRHLEYAVTWFGIAAALVVISGTLIWRRMRPARP